MELLPVVCLCLLTRCGITSADGNDPIVVKVEEDRNVILPCSLSTKENIESIVFDWRKTQKDGKREVFYYEDGIHYNNGRPGQSEEFKGRVSHFQGELKHGNASIIIRNAKLADSGDYTCDFPYLQPRQKFPIELVVDCVLKDRTRDKKHGTCPKPHLKKHDPTKDGVLLECAVLGASPIPKVELKDSSGNNVSAEEPQVTKIGDLYDIILQATVTKTDTYSCVSTQEEICHQISSDTHVSVNETELKLKTRTNNFNTTGNNRTKTFLKRWSQSGSKGTLVRLVCGERDISVYEGDPINLSCSLGTKENIESEMFEWKKDGLKEVFFYGGIHYNSNRPGQSGEFKGRVSHFPHKLKRGGASITIQNAQMSDSGIYTCVFPRLQPPHICHIELDIVERVKPKSGASSHSSDQMFRKVMIGVAVGVLAKSLFL